MATVVTMYHDYTLIYGRIFMNRKKRIALVLLVIGLIIILFQIKVTGVTTQTFIMTGLFLCSAAAAAWGKRTPLSEKLRPVMFVFVAVAFALLVWATFNLIKSYKAEVSERNSATNSFNSLSVPAPVWKSEKQSQTTESESHNTVSQLMV